jgi:hypothetical protein
MRGPFVDTLSTTTVYEIRSIDENRGLYAHDEKRGGSDSGRITGNSEVIPLAW